VHKDKYFSLLLPTQSPGLQLEAMLITTEDKGEKLFSIYHRLHFDEQMYPDGPRVIEADAFLHLSAVLVNVALTKKADAIANVLNFQVQEALEIEITMLTLAESDEQIAQDNISPFINNTIGRYMLAAQLDGSQYLRPSNEDSLGHYIAEYCDLPFESVATGIKQLPDFMDEVIKAEDMFISSFASSSLCLMLLLIEHKTSSAMLETGNFKTVKEFLINNKEIYNLRDIFGEGEHLGNFQALA